MNSGFLQRSWLCNLAGIAGICVLGATGCDTVALISFQEREFQSVKPAGFTATSAACGEGVQDGQAELRFVLLADDNTPIKPGEAVGKRSVELSRDDITFSGTKLFETPDVLCGDEAASCRFDSFDCGAGPEAGFERCQQDAALSINGDIQFESDTTSNQLFGVLYENSGSLVGYLPENLGVLYADFDGDGVAESGQDQLRDPARATDQNGRRKSALTFVVNSWGSARDHAAANGNRETLFGLWSFSGTSRAEVRSWVSEATDGAALWTGSRDFADAAKAQMTGPANEPGRSRANVFQAIDEVLTQGYALPEYDDHEKTLVVFVDGPDELRLSAATADQVVEKAAAQGVRLFIVHLDPAVASETLEGTPVLRDDVYYWKDSGQQPCADDTECKNFESCRVPHGYASSEGVDVEAAYDPMGQTYCMPERDENGRIGPVREYEEIACATGGAYVYVKDSAALSRRMDWIPFTMDGLWKVPVVIDRLENQQVPEDEAYKLETTMTVTVGGRTVPYSFSQNGEQTTTQDDAKDTRAIIFN